MSDWSDRFKNSPIWAALTELGPAIDNAEKREGVEPASLEALSRLRTVLTFAGKRLAAADPLLIQPGPVDSAGAHVQSAVGEVQQFTANGSTGHLVNANSQLDNALMYLAQLNVPLAPSDLQALQEAANKYRDALVANAKGASGAVATVAKDAEALTAKLSELSQEMASERQRLSSLTSDFQAQFSTAQESRSTESSAAQVARQEKLAEWLASSAEALAKQDAAFKQDRASFVERHEATLEELKSDHEQRADVILKLMEKHRVDVEKLVGVIGNLGVTSGYLKTANEAKVTARVWQGVTVFAMLLLIVVGYFAFLPIVRATFSWEGFAGRVFFTLTIGVLAAYAASQADKFLNSERRNRALALELEALGPYLAPLPEDKQQEFRLAIGDRTFGREQGGAGTDGKSPATVIDMLVKSKEFRAFITEIVKAARG